MLDAEKIVVKEKPLFGETHYYDENGVYLGYSIQSFFHVNYFDAIGRRFEKTKFLSEDEEKRIFARHGYTSPPPQLHDDDFFDGLLCGMILSDNDHERKKRR